MVEALVEALTAEGRVHSVQDLVMHSHCSQCLRHNLSSPIPPRCHRSCRQKRMYKYLYTDSQVVVGKVEVAEDADLVKVAVGVEAEEEGEGMPAVVVEALMGGGRDHSVQDLVMHSHRSQCLSHNLSSPIHPHCHRSCRQKRICKYSYTGSQVLGGKDLVEEAVGQRVGVGVVHSVLDRSRRNQCRSRTRHIGVQPPHHRRYRHLDKSTYLSNCSLEAGVALEAEVKEGTGHSARHRSPSSRFPAHRIRIPTRCHHHRMHHLSRIPGHSCMC